MVLVRFQFVEPADPKGYDYARTLRLATFGLLIHGPTGHLFYGALDRRLPGTKPVTVATKVHERTWVLSWPVLIHLHGAAFVLLKKLTLPPKGGY